MPTLVAVKVAPTNRRLAEPLHRLAGQLRSEENDDQPDQQIVELHYRINATITGPQAVKMMLPSA